MKYEKLSLENINNRIKTGENTLTVKITCLQRADKK